MNWRRIPVIPTLLVITASAYMVHLGFWQLDRLRQKEAMIARFTAAMTDSSVIDAGSSSLGEKAGYHRVRLNCPKAGPDQMVSGRRAGGQVGWAHVVVCAYQDSNGSEFAAVALGWSSDLKPVKWDGGEVTGWAVDGQKGGIIMPAIPKSPPIVESLRPYHIVADPPLAGLQPNAKPDPHNLPNNHLSYAMQWFAFALTALVIYGLALRKRLKAEPQP